MLNIINNIKKSIYERLFEPYIASTYELEFIKKIKDTEKPYLIYKGVPSEGESIRLTEFLYRIEYVDENKLAHCIDGPAIIYKNHENIFGNRKYWITKDDYILKIFAIHGKRMTFEEYLSNPETSLEYKLKIYNNIDEYFGKYPKYY